MKVLFTSIAFICFVTLLSGQNDTAKTNTKTSNIDVLDELANIEDIVKPKIDELIIKQPQLGSINPYLNIETSGEIYELKPMIVRPKQSLDQKVETALRDHKFNFLTAKGIREEYLKDLPDWDVKLLNKFTIPLFGINPTVRAAIRARNLRFRKHFESYRQILEVQREFHPLEFRDSSKQYYQIYLEIN